MGVVCVCKSFYVFIIFLVGSSRFALTHLDCDMSSLSIYQSTHFNSSLSSPMIIMAMFVYATDDRRPATCELRLRLRSFMCRATCDLRPATKHAICD